MSDRQSPERAEDRIDREAAQWFARSSGELNAAERDEYAAWLKSDERHSSAIEEYQRLRKDFRMLQDRLELPSEAGTQGTPQRLTTVITRWRFPAAVLGLAACLIVALILDVSWFDGIGGNETADTLVYRAEGFERHFLPDGSMVELRGDSTLEAQFSQRLRSIRLKRGEAYFSVAPDPSRPFVVRAGDASFRAVGTAFNVRLTREEVVMLVTEGQVSVDSLPAPTAEPAPSRKAPGDPLRENQKIAISLRPDAPEPSVQTVAVEEADRELDWKHEILYFENLALSEAVNEFNQRNRRQIEIRDSDVANERIDGSFRSDDLPAFIELLEIAGRIEATPVGQDTIALRRLSQ